MRSKALTWLASSVAVVVAGVAVAACSGDGASHEGHDHTGSTTAPRAPTAAAIEEMTPSKDYPLDTCVVSGEPIGGDMGEPMAVRYQGTEVQFCCPDCMDEFAKDPEKYVAKVRAATR